MRVNGANPKVVLKTNMGDIELELYPDKAPISVENFLSYVNSGFYDNTIFHRVIKGAIIQGGGYTEDLEKKQVNDPIQNEANNRLKNNRGTIAYARLPTGIHTATSQFFINLANNRSLDYTSNTLSGYGYAVFGKVTEGMNIVDKIGSMSVSTQKGLQNVPVKPVIILSAKAIDEEEDD
ncbi:peptidylprolyl isomerase [bacterium]|nr:peptidylprolyl isomerase [bacterium]RQV95081.1 MAG: peptidylprolyl isomerase [bacterium]